MIEQGKIHELEEYIQLGVSDPDYIPPSQIWIAVDNQTWTKPKKIAYDVILNELHVEAGRLTNLSSRAVSYTFPTAFETIPSDTIIPYRVFEPRPGEPVRETVRITDLAVTLTGFSFNIDINEDLDGVVINFMIIEV